MVCDHSTCVATEEPVPQNVDVAHASAATSGDGQASYEDPDDFDDDDDEYVAARDSVADVDWADAIRQAGTLINNDIAANSQRNLEVLRRANAEIERLKRERQRASAPARPIRPSVPPPIVFEKGDAAKYPLNNSYCLVFDKKHPENDKSQCDNVSPYDGTGSQRTSGSSPPTNGERVSGGAPTTSKPNSAADAGPGMTISIDGGSTPTDWTPYRSLGPGHEGLEIRHKVGRFPYKEGKHEIYVQLRSRYQCRVRVNVRLNFEPTDSYVITHGGEIASGGEMSASGAYWIKRRLLSAQVLSRKCVD